MVNPSAVEAVLLGAGFSCAINGYMPVADQLGSRAYSVALDRSPGLVSAAAAVFNSEYPFEMWLSLLAQDLPYLSEAQNCDNAAAFAKIRDAIADALHDAQDEALRCEAPEWLYTLLGILHHLRAQVVTFNYDTLVEAGVDSVYLGTSGWASQVDERRPWAGGALAYSRITSWDVLRGQPPIPPAFDGSRSESADTFRLLKLHGSLDWWQVPSDSSGATLSRSHVLPTFGDAARLSDADRRRYLPARERFIVPPLAVKSSYYSNPMGRQLWQDAYDALRQAQRIALVGYSLPITDIVSSGLLARAMAHRDDLTVDVVNPDADEVGKRITALGGPDEKSGRLVLTDSVSTFVGRLAIRAQERVVEALLALRPPATHPGTVVVTWAAGVQPGSGVVDHMVDRPDHTLQLVLASHDLVKTTATEGEPTVVDLLRRVGRATRLTVLVEGSILPIVNFTTPDFENPSVQHPIFLQAAGRRPPS